MTYCDLWAWDKKGQSLITAAVPQKVQIYRILVRLFAKARVILKLFFGNAPCGQCGTITATVLASLSLSFFNILIILRLLETLTYLK